MSVPRGVFFTPSEHGDGVMIHSEAEVLVRECYAGNASTELHARGVEFEDGQDERLDAALTREVHDYRRVNVRNRYFELPLEPLCAKGCYSCAHGERAFKTGGRGCSALTGDEDEDQPIIGYVSEHCDEDSGMPKDGAECPRWELTD